MPPQNLLPKMPPQSLLPKTPSRPALPGHHHLRSQIRSQLPREWQSCHKPRDDSPSVPSTKLSAIFACSHASFPGGVVCFLLRHRLEPGLCPRREEEVETTVHAPLRCPVCQFARRSSPGTMDLHSAWYDVVEMLAAFVRHILTAYPRGHRRPNPTPPPPQSVRLGPAPLIPDALGASF